MAVPAGWTDTGQLLKAPNGFVVERGFREHILKSAWDANNWPLESEHPRLNGGQGTQQVFRQCVLEWTWEKDVYKAFYWGP